MHRNVPAWLLTFAVVLWSGIHVECLRAASRETSAAGQVTLRQTPLGPMPANTQQISISPDGSRVALVANSGSRQQVFIDGNEGPQYSQIMQLSGLQQGWPGPRMLMISPDQTRVAYAAKKGPSDCVMVVNNKEGPVFENIIYATFSPVGHRLAYIATKGGKQYVIVDATISAPYEWVMPSDFSFTADGTHYGYTAAKGAGNKSWRVVIDDKEGPEFINVQRLQFCKDGTHYAYVAERENNVEKNNVVVDDKVGPELGRIQSITLSDDGKHIAYAASLPRDPKVASTGSPKWVAVIDGKQSEQFDEISNIVISPDGNHAAFWGSETKQRTVVYAVVDGKKSLDYTACNNFIYSPDSQRVAYQALSSSGKSVVVLDGKESEAHGSIDSTSMRFSPDSKRLCYIAIDQPNQSVVVDGKAGPIHGAVDPRSLQFSADSKHVRYRIRGQTDSWTWAGDDLPADATTALGDVVTTADGKHTAMTALKNLQTQQESAQVMLDGKQVGETYSQVQQLQISADGKHVGYIATFPAGSEKKLTHAVIDGRDGPQFNRIDKLLLSPDGQHIAYACTDETGKHHLVVDSLQGPEYEDIFLGVTQQLEGMQFRADGSLEFLPVTETKLNRVVMPADVMRSLPKPVAPNAPGAVGYSQVYAFGQVKDDGAKPAVMAAGPDGTLFGATAEGGEFKKGVIFSVKPDGSGYKILRPIEGGRGDGAYPSSMWVGKDGMIYGSMQGEGPNGYGIVYRATADGSAYTILHPFTGNKDGGGPVIYAVDPDGTLYGVSNRDRNPLHLFRIKPDGDFSIVYDAPPMEPETAVGPFVDGGDGYFYGVAGTNIFKVKKDGTGYAVVRKFAGPPRDISLADRAPILGADGILYGFSSSDAVIYKIARDGSGYALVVKPSDNLFSLRAIAEGPDGRIYALAEKGFGTVSKDGGEFTILQELNGGFFPWCALVRDGVFYSMTAQGNKGGFIFRYGIGAPGGNGSGGDAAAAAPTVVFQMVPPTPIDSNVEIPPAAVQ